MKRRDILKAVPGAAVQRIVIGEERAELVRAVGERQENVWNESSLLLDFQHPRADVFGQILKLRHRITADGGRGHANESISQDGGWQTGRTPNAIWRAFQWSAKSTRVCAPLSVMSPAPSFAATTNTRSEAIPPGPTNHSLTARARRFARARRASSSAG